MIKNNKFNFKKLKNIIFLGEDQCLKEFIKFNNNLGIKSEIITSPSQASSLDPSLKFKKFLKLDKKFQRYISSKYKIEESLFISVASRWIFTESLIKNFFKTNIINFHGARLPFDSGGGGFSWNIMRNDRIGVQLVHLVTKEIDKGPIINYEKFLFPYNCKISKDFYSFYNDKFKIFYKKFITNLKANKKYDLIKQPDYIGRYNPRLFTKKDGWIDWSQSSEEILNFINAFDEPYEGASTMIGKQKCRIKNAQLHGGEGKNHPFMSGLILRHDKRWVVVATKDNNCLIIETVTDFKKQNILQKIKPGQRFYTDIKKLNYSKSKRAFFNSKGLKIN